MGRCVHAVAEIGSQSFEHIGQIEQMVEGWFPESWNVHGMVNDFLMDCRHRFHAAQAQAQDDEVDTSLLAKGGTVIMVTFMLYFASSCIQQFAQQQAALEAEQEGKKQE